MTTATQRSKLDDLLADEFNPEYNRVEAVVKNATGDAVNLAGSRGIFVKSISNVYCLCLEADLASAVGIILSDKPIALADAATDTEKHVILVRGPAIIRKDGISTTDAAGEAQTVATGVAALAALTPPIVTKAQATQYTTQDT